jgi:hypothetical protein
MQRELSRRTIPPRAQATQRTKRTKDEVEPPRRLAIQTTLWPDEEPEQIVGHAVEFLRREDGVYLTVCKTHSRDCLGRRNPCA